MRTLITAALAATLVAGAAAPAFAADKTEETTVVVNLTTLSSEPLEARIVRAAERACERPYMRDLRMMAAYNECVSASSAEAMAKANVALALADTTRS